MLSSDIPAWFDAYGWRYERREAGLFRTGFVGDHGAWDIWVNTSKAWVFFTISPYVQRPQPSDSDDVAPHYGPTVHRALLQANLEMNLAKFAIDDDGDISLSVELPTEGFSYCHFSDALGALSHYADEFCERMRDAVRIEAGAL